jgi:hypothetical protein
VCAKACAHACNPTNLTTSWWPSSRAALLG